MLPQHSEDEDSQQLATDRLILRRPVAGDLPAFALLANNRNVTENTASMPYPYKLEDAQTWFDNRTTIACEKGASFIIALAETDEIIGCAGWDEVPDMDLPQIGYWIGEPFWNRGFATEAAHAAIDWAFSTSSVEIIGCGCRVTNGASRRVIEKCGFQYDGLGMVHFRSHGGALPILKYQLDRNTWTSLKAWGAKSAA